MNSGGNGTIMQKILDAYLLALQAEKDPNQRDIILGKMIKEVGYTVENHVSYDILSKQRINLTMGGLITAVSILSGVVWWLVQCQGG
jgi:hypothetical protein